MRLSYANAGVYWATGSERLRIGAPPEGGIIHHRLHSSKLPGVTASSSFTACTTASTHSPAYQSLNDGLSGYLECLNAAVYRIDDGKRDVSSVAHAVKEICAQEFAKGQCATLDPAMRRIFEQRSEARQFELSTMVVLDARGQP